jgi:hypothetical protein
LRDERSLPGACREELEVARLRTVIQALRVVAPLLAEDADLKAAIVGDKEAREAIMGERLTAADFAKFSQSAER